MIVSLRILRDMVCCHPTRVLYLESICLYVVCHIIFEEKHFQPIWILQNYLKNMASIASSTAVS